YELLSGEPPFHPRRLMEAGFGEIQRIIREETPPKPSTKSTTIEDAQKIAELRCLDLNGLRKRLHGDLDWIAMKALEKDRTRRYATVQELAADLGRHLADEPVEAGPPSARYRFVKFVRRNRVGVAAGALVLLALAAGIAATTWQWRKAESAEQEARTSQKTAVSERNRAQRAEQDAVTERDKAKEAQEEATQARDEARQRSEELAKVNTELSAEREKLSVEKARLEKVVEFQEGTLTGLDASKMGLTLMRLFREGIAEQLTQTRRMPAEVKEAVARFSQLAVRANPTDVAKGLLSEEILTAAVATIDKGFTGDPITEASLRAAVAKVYKDLGLYDEALPLYESALALRRKHLGDEHPDTLSSINNLGLLLHAQGKHAEAETLLGEALEGRRRTLGDEHPHTLISIKNLGSLLLDQDKYAEAETLWREAREGCRRKFGDEHPDTLISIGNLGALLYSQGKYAEAETLLGEALEGSRRELGDEHPDTLCSINNLGALLHAQGKFNEAETLLGEALEGYRRIFGDEHANTLRVKQSLEALINERKEAKTTPTEQDDG
ncbi:MAG: tetratricopeptide repeat protein, partial [Myxococcota bacterium]|nr:tetratricopeptide repeat protein [Myxococcota bacterium]